MTVHAGADAPQSSTYLARPAIALLGALVIVIAATLGYLVGRHQGDAANGTRVLTGRAHVGDDIASVRVHGWSYGFTPSAVEWFDSRGSHDGGTAPCLTRVGSEATITFGWVAAALPQDQGFRDVVWVRCGG